MLYFVVLMIRHAQLKIRCAEILAAYDAMSQMSQTLGSSIKGKYRTRWIGYDRAYCSSGIVTSGRCNSYEGNRGVLSIASRIPIPLTACQIA